LDLASCNATRGASLGPSKSYRSSRDDIVRNIGRNWSKSSFRRRFWQYAVSHYLEQERVLDADVVE
jgi:hypothetical protein